jgi:hypothetical protein
VRVMPSQLCIWTAYSQALPAMRLFIAQSAQRVFLRLAQQRDIDGHN